MASVREKRLVLKQCVLQLVHSAYEWGGMAYGGPNRAGIVGYWL